MKSAAYSVVFMFALAMLFSVSQAVAQTTVTEQPMRVTLYSPEKHKLTNAPPLSNGKLRPDVSRAFFSFTSGTLSTPRNFDLSIGVIYGGGGDWFVLSSVTGDDRSAIRDLGKSDWNDNFKVPVVAPLPVLEPGDARYITTGGKKGEGSASILIIRDSNTQEINMLRDPGDWPELPATVSPSRETNTNRLKDAKRLEPALAQVVSGHMYVIHVVKAQSDFYVLVHVDSLKEGDKCTISWKRIPSP